MESKFFASLEKSAGISIPNFLLEALLCAGFEDAASFRLIKDTQEDEFFKQIEFQIKRLIRNNTNSPIYNEAKVHFKRTSDSDNVDDYVLPMGFRNKLLAVREHCVESHVKIEKKSTTSSVPKRLSTNKFDEIKIKKFKQRIVKEFNMLVAEQYRLDDEDEINIELSENSCSLTCVLCPAVISVYEVARNQLNFGNFKTHVIKKHRDVLINFENNSSIDSLEPEIDNSILVPDETNIQVAAINENDETSIETVIEEVVPRKRQKKNVITPNLSLSPRKTRRSFFIEEDFEESMTDFLRMCVENSRTTIPGYVGNRFSDDIKDIASYMHVHMGTSQYEFLSSNLNLPHVSSVRKYMTKELKPLKEGELDFDGLKDYLIKNKFSLNVGLFEDGTKIVESIDYEKDGNCLIGLSGKLQAFNGMPIINGFKARTAAEIHSHIKNEAVAGYVQVLLIQPNSSFAHPFLLGFYATNNRFTNQDVVNRNNYIYAELKKRGIRLLCVGSDGDSRFLAAQKKAIDFGKLTEFGPLVLAGNLDSKYFGHQDVLHIMKRLKHKLSDLCSTLIMGNFHATINHLIIMTKTFEKHHHKLVPSDLDIFDRLNYKSMEKIIDECVIKTLRMMKNTEGTIAFIELMKKLQIAYVDGETITSQRIENAVYCAHFIRYWKQWQIENKISAKFFITSNCWDGIEINLVMIIALSLEGLEHDISELSSQKCEEFFRLLRSLSGVESTIVNITLKLFQSRIHRIKFADQARNKLKDKINFPRLIRLNAKQERPKTQMHFNEIIAAITKGVHEAETKCNDLGMKIQNKIDRQLLSTYLKSVSSNSSITDETLNEEETNNSNFLEINPNNSNIQDEDIDNILTYELSDFVFSNEASDNSFLKVVKGPKEILSKAQLIQMISYDKKKVSSDVRYRFQDKKLISFKKVADNERSFWKETIISKGDYVVLKVGDQTIAGCVLNLKFMKGKSKAQVLHVKDNVNLNETEKNHVEVLLSPIYVIDVQGPKEIMLRDYFDIKNYFCHCKSDVNFHLSNIYDSLYTMDV